MIGQSTLEHLEVSRRHRLRSRSIEGASLACFRDSSAQGRRATAVVDLQVQIGGRVTVLRLSVVLGGAPLLLSRPLLRHLGAIIDMMRGGMKLALDVEVSLEASEGRHLLIDLVSAFTRSPRGNSSSPSGENSVWENMDIDAGSRKEEGNYG